MLMSEFKGWTPATVDNLTFDQLDAIINGLNRRIRRMKGGTEVPDATKIPVSKGKKEEMDAWFRVGCPPTFESFVKKLRKNPNG